MTAPDDRPQEEIPDVSAAYHLWDDLFDELLRLALSTATDDPCEREEALERLARGMARSFVERDVMWERVLGMRDEHGRG